MAAVAALAMLVLGAVPGPAQPPAWSPQPWLDDLAQARAAIEGKYANLEWLLTEREVDLDALFARARAALGNAGSDPEAVAISNRLVQRIGDGHVGLSWPRPPSRQSAPMTASPPPERPGELLPARAIDSANAAASPGAERLCAGGRSTCCRPARSGRGRRPASAIRSSSRTAATPVCRAVAAIALTLDRPSTRHAATRSSPKTIRRLPLHAGPSRPAALRGAHLLIVESPAMAGARMERGGGAILSRRPLPVGADRVRGAARIGSAVARAFSGLRTAAAEPDGRRARMVAGRQRPPQEPKPARAAVGDRPALARPRGFSNGWSARPIGSSMARMGVQS